MRIAELSENIEGKEVKDFPVRPTSPILPKFIFVGTTKSGSTTLLHTLLKHPQMVTTPDADERYGDLYSFFNHRFNDDLPVKEQVITFIIYLPETF